MLALAYQLRQNFKFPYFPGWWVGGETKIKAKLSPAKAGAWAELSNNAVNIGHSSVTAHASHLDQCELEDLELLQGQFSCLIKRYITYHMMILF
jgi:putative salt-induced outer membrane protein YdiY